MTLSGVLLHSEAVPVITPGLLRHVIDNPPPFKVGMKYAGLDLATGRDENALAVRSGNCA